MSIGPAELPLLLAGPVLRRVESDLVCVWIATSQRCTASPLLFDGTDVVAADTPLGDLRADWVSDVQPTLHFWIGRSKTPRRSDIAPALRFDVVEYR